MQIRPLFLGIVVVVATACSGNPGPSIDGNLLTDIDATSTDIADADGENPMFDETAAADADASSSDIADADGGNPMFDEAEGADADASSSDVADADGGNPMFDEAAGAEADAASADVADADGEDPLGCNSQCECPAGTTCTVEHECVGFPDVRRCAADGTCPCDQVCTDGFCPPFIGSLRPCQHSCACQRETCAGGVCVRASGSFGGTCSSNPECSACDDTICILPTALCAPEGSCQSDRDCLNQGSSGFICDCAPARREDYQNGLNAFCDYQGYPAQGPYFGNCTAILGTPYLQDQALTLSDSSGACDIGEFSTLAVAGAAPNPSSIFLYVEGVSDTGWGQNPWFVLFSPSGTFVHRLNFSGDYQTLIVFALPSIPTQVNGTWKMCAEIVPAQTTLSKWGLYISP